MIITAILSALALFGVASSFPHTKHQLITRNNPGEKWGNIGIYNGNSTKMNDHRYLVGIVNQGSFLCAGAIVSSTWIVTIADCTNLLEAADLTVIGSSNDGVTGKEYTVTSIVEHPNYKKSTLDYNFACLQVESAFYYWNWRAHKLPTEEPTSYTTFNVAGYGFTNAKSSSRELRKTSMTLLPKTICKESYIDVSLDWTPRMRCAYNPDGATLCSGDFGDAFVVGKVLYGLFMAGCEDGFCTNTALPVVMADVYQVAEWIHDTTGAEYA